MERTEAKKLGHNTYETGRECKNGHLTYRYTQSGTCAGCINAANGRGAPTPTGQKREERLAHDAAAAALKEARAQLVQVKLRAFNEDLEALKAAAHAFGVMRCPALTMGHVYPGLLALDAVGGTALYKFNCHMGDVEPLRALAVSMVNARANASGAGAAGYQMAVERVTAGIVPQPVPEWAERP